MLARADSALGAVAAQDPKWAAPLVAAGDARLPAGAARLASGGRHAAAVGERSTRDSSARRRRSPRAERRRRARGAWLAALPAVAARTSRRAASRTTPSTAAEADLSGVDQGEPGAGVGDEHAEPPVSSPSGRTSDGKLTARRRLQGRPVSDRRQQDRVAAVPDVAGPGLASEAKKWCDEGARRFPTDYRFAECRLWLLTLRDQQPPPTADAIWKAYDAYLAANKVDKPEFAKRKGMMLAGSRLIRAGLAGQRASGDRPRPGRREHRPGGRPGLSRGDGARAARREGQGHPLLSGITPRTRNERRSSGRDEAWCFKSLENDHEYRIGRSERSNVS